MIVKDRVYGSINIRNRLLQEIILSDPFQRLNQINQYGGSVFLDPSRNVTRFEHSIGVWYLLNKFGANIEEQVAGLLHDVPHTAFSHVVDLVFPNEENDFHERFHEEIILNSDLPKILKSHGISLDRVLNKGKFELLEAKLPDLSADRIDYFLRDTRPCQLFPVTLVNEFLNDLVIIKKKFVFKSLSLATLYSVLFVVADKLLWTDPDSVGSFHLLALAIKRGMSKGILDQSDLFKTDSYVFNLLRSEGDSTTKSLLRRLTPNSRFEFTSLKDSEYQGSVKVRAVDPLVKTSQGCKRVSVLNPSVNTLISEHFSRHDSIYVRQKKSI